MGRQALSVLFLSSLLAACGAAPEPTSEGRPWRVLFDGANMDAWEDPAGKSPPGNCWAIEDGSLKTVKDPLLREDLVTKDSFGDFELEFEWKLSPGGNSGVKYLIQDSVWLPEPNPPGTKFENRVTEEMRSRTLTRDKLKPGSKYQEYLVAFEYQLIDRNHPDVAHGSDRVTGAIYRMIAPSARAPYQAGEFNRARIVLRGNRVEHWLNGTKILDAALDDPRIAAGLAERWTADSPVYELLAKQPKKRTPIALQHHIDEVWFRGVRIREF